MKIAYIIGAHSDPNNLRRLVLSLGRQDFYIHVDLKSDIEPFQKGLENVKNVHFIKNRVKVYWGGWSQVEMLLNCLNEVKECGIYDRVVSLSGMDYPAVPYENIEALFNNNPYKEFLRARVVTGDHEISDKVVRYWKFDYNISSQFLRRLIRGTHNRIFGNILKRLGMKKPDTIEINRRKWKVYFGSDFWALTWESAMNVTKYLNHERLKKYFKSSYAPSELITQTIVCNTVDHKNIDLIISGKCKYEDLCSLHYEVYDPIIQIMTEKDMEAILSSDKCFFRKSRSGLSDALIENLRDFYNIS